MPEYDDSSSASWLRLAVLIAIILKAKALSLGMRLSSCLILTMCGNCCIVRYMDDDFTKALLWMMATAAVAAAVVVLLLLFA